MLFCACLDFYIFQMTPLDFIMQNYLRIWLQALP